MNGSTQRSRVQPSPAKPLAFAVALALSGIANFPSANAYPISEQQARVGVYAIAASSRPEGSTESVNTNQVIQQHPRDGIYAIQVYPSSESMTSDPLSTQFSNWVGRAKSFAGSTWDKTTSLLTQESGVSPSEPQRYGRAGGFVGMDQYS